jgi:hypothetical protein
MTVFDVYAVPASHDNDPKIRRSKTVVLPRYTGS